MSSLGYIVGTVRQGRDCEGGRGGRGGGGGGRIGSGGVHGSGNYDTVWFCKKGLFWWVGLGRGLRGT